MRDLKGNARWTEGLRFEVLISAKVWFMTLERDSSNV